MPDRKRLTICPPDAHIINLNRGFGALGGTLAEALGVKADCFSRLVTDLMFTLDLHKHAEGGSQQVSQKIYEAKTNVILFDFIGKDVSYVSQPGIL